MFDDKSNVVVILPDHGSRYMSKIYNDEWMNNQGFNKNDEEIVHQIEYI
jgi:cystathionine beta-synthase